MYAAWTFLPERILAVEGEGITWIGQASGEGIALFSVRLEFGEAHRNDFPLVVIYMCAPRALGFVPSAVFRLYRGDNRIQDYSTKNRRVSGLGSSFGEPQGQFWCTVGAQ
jgi:hypothetical protein